MLDVYFRATPLAAVGMVVALMAATALAAVAVRTHYAAPLRVWLYVAALGSYAAVTVLPSVFDGDWQWHSPLDVGLEEPYWTAFVAGIDAASLNVWIGVPLGVGAALLALDIRRWWPLVVAVLAPWFAEWWQAVAPIARHGLSGDDLANNVYGIVVGVLLGLVVDRSLTWLERRTRTNAS